MITLALLLFIPTEILISTLSMKTDFLHVNHNIQGRDEFCAHNREELQEEHSAEEMAQHQYMTADKGRLVEGDIKLPLGLTRVSQLIEMRRKKVKKMGRSYQRKDVVTATELTWPSAEIPYEIDSSLGSLAREVIHSAIKDFNDFTCVRFVPRSSQLDYIRFVAGNGCYSMVGKQGGAQDISLGPGCEWKGTAIHEMMHALGFFHEISRLDRDQFVEINFENIDSAMSTNFEKYADGVADFFGEPYDYMSVMHYGSHAFSKNGQVTIIPKSPAVSASELGQRKGFSEIDLKQIRKVFKCDHPSVTSAPSSAAASALPTAGPVPSSSVRTSPKLTSPIQIWPSSTTAPTPAVNSERMKATLIPPAYRLPTGHTSSPVQTHVPGPPSPPCSTNHAYPFWPTGFYWSLTIPLPCLCQTTSRQFIESATSICRCKCVRVSDVPHVESKYDQGYVCYQKSKMDPQITFTSKADVRRGQRCVPGLRSKRFFCFDETTPYRFRITKGNPHNVVGETCLRIGSTAESFHLCGRSA